MQSYKGAQIFEAVGLRDEVVDRCFVGTASRIQGVNFDVLAEEALRRHALGYPQHHDSRLPILPNPGEFHWRAEGERHMWDPQSIADIQVAARAGDQNAYQRFADHVNLDNLYKDDVTTERFSVVGGSIAVPKGPGLGVTLDRKKLEKYKKTPKPAPVRLLVRVKYRNGLTIFYRHNPEAPGALLRLRSLSRVDVPGPVPGYRNSVVGDFWEADGSTGS